MSASIDPNEHPQKYIDALVKDLKQRGVLTSSLIEQAFRSVPRHLFVDRFYVYNEAHQNWYLLPPPPTTNLPVWLEAVYTDESLVTDFDKNGIPVSASSAPWVMSLMLEAIELKSGLRILEIGTGTGYNAALLAYIVEKPALVYSIEINQKLIQKAEKRIKQVVGDGITLHLGNGLHGLELYSPYDRILATGSYHKIPLSWLDQLQSDGIVMMNLRGNLSAGMLVLRKVGEQRTARGQFLNTPPIGFMNLLDASSHPPAPLSEFRGSKPRPKATTFPLSVEILDPSILDDANFLFFLQFELPQVSLSQISDLGEDQEPMTWCLTDAASQTTILISPSSQEQEQGWTVELRGELFTLEKLFHAYEWWKQLQCPRICDYQVEVTPSGKQLLTLSQQLSGTNQPTWEL